MLPVVVVFLFCLLYTAAIAAQTKDAAEYGKRRADVNIAVPEPDARKQIQSLGFGSRIDVKLKSGSTASGRITAIAVDRFVVTNTKGAARSIPYADVTQVTKQREKLGLFHEPWVGIMFTAAGMATLIVLALALFD